MIWSFLPWFSFAILVLWGTGSWIATRQHRILAAIIIFAGSLCLAAFLSLLWYDFGRPPMRTMGETRLLYALFLSVLGVVVALRWRYAWFLVVSTLLASTFLIYVVIRPESQSITLMPALQSPWFVPHVTLYILSYAVLGVATLASLRQIWLICHGETTWTLLHLIDELVKIGFGLLLLGLLTGAVWAKEAWGHYWAWDPKETWAFITACSYLCYLHSRSIRPVSCWILMLLPISFVLLMITWLGVGFLPAAQTSVHVYTS